MARRRIPRGIDDLDGELHELFNDGFGGHIEQER